MDGGLHDLAAQGGGLGKVVGVAGGLEGNLSGWQTCFMMDRLAGGLAGWHSWGSWSWLVAYQEGDWLTEEVDDW